MAISRRAFVSGASAAIIAGATPRSAWAATDADVIVIGAGLAGLCAAHRLDAAGLNYHLIEAEPRVGGRLHTLDALPGKPEAGGIQVGSQYRRLLAIADDLKVPLIAGGGEPRGVLYRIRGATVRAEDWAGSPVNRLSPAERSVAPARLATFYAAKLPPLDGVEAWMTPSAIAAFDTSWASRLRALGASREAMRLIDTNLNGNSIATLSALHIARSAAIFRAGTGPTLTISGGSQRIAEAMAQRLGQGRGIKSFQTGTRVTAIREEADRVQVRLESGVELSARYAICTVPFAALRSVRIDTPNPLLGPVLDHLAYTHGTFIYLNASEPFWRSTGDLGTLWTDDPVLARVFVLGDDPAMLKIFATGRAADLLDRLGPERAGREAIRRLAAAMPSSKGKLSVAGMFSWQAQPSARGIYHHLTPGIAPKLAALATRTEGRLHFAGEHLALQASGMEGALESGNRIAQMIAARG